MLFLTFAITVFMSGMLQRRYVDKVFVEIDYDGFWNATIVNGGEHEVSGISKRRFTVVNNFEEVWRLTVKAYKLDDSSRTLTIRVVSVDGAVLCKSSTSKKGGVTSLSIFIN